MTRFTILFSLALLLVNLQTPASRSAIDAPRFVSLEGGFSIALRERYKQLSRLSFPFLLASRMENYTSGRLKTWSSVLAIPTIIYLSATLKLSNNCSKTIE
jgi:hypothetical protein